MIDKVCARLSNKIGRELQVSENEKAVIHYGLFAIIHTSISIGAIVLAGSFLGVLIPALILSVTTVILRKYSGGAHASSPESCAIIGVIISVGGAWLLSKMHWNLIVVIISVLVIFILGFYKVYQLAPVDSMAKPIRKQEKKEALKKKSIFTLGVYLVGTIGLLSIYLTKQKDIVLVWVMCICIGIFWQILTLTPLGHLIVEKIDLFLIHTILRRKGECTDEKD